MKKFLLFNILILLTACANFTKIKDLSLDTYKLEINQGNEISQENIEQINIGDPKEKVIKIMGYPLIQDPFHKERWDYQYYFKNKNNVQNKRITIFFKNNKVVDIIDSQNI